MKSLLLCLALCVGAAAQLRPSTATLAGTLWSAGGGPPLEDTRVGLTTLSNTVVYETTTQAGGQFFFENIRPGAYIVVVKRDEFMVEVGRVQLTAGADLERSYTKGVVIAGIVRDEAGKPVGAVPVCALRRSSEGGTLRFAPEASDLTDARGRFLVGQRASMPPGEYVAAVMPAGCSISIPAGQPTDRAGRYPPVYFPGVTAPRDATAMELNAFEDRTLNFRIAPGPVTRVEGRLMGYQNTTIVPGLVILDPPDEPVSIVRTARIGGDGRFVFPGLPPGRYRLIAAPRKGPDPPRWGVHTITLTGEPVARVVFGLQPTVGVAGTIDFAGHLTALYGTRIFLVVSAHRVGERPAVAGLLPQPFAPVGVDGRFAMTGLMPGRYKLAVIGAEPVGWRMKSAPVPTADALAPPIDAFDAPFLLEPNRSIFGLKVLMTYKTNTVSGTIEDEEGQPTANAFVLIFAPDPRYWIRGSRRIAVVAGNRTGAFTTDRLPEGEYLAVAVRTVTAWPDPQRLELLRPIATPFTLGDGDTRELALRLAAATVLSR